MLVVVAGLIGATLLLRSWSPEGDAPQAAADARPGEPGGDSAAATVPVASEGGTRDSGTTADAPSPIALADEGNIPGLDIREHQRNLDNPGRDGWTTEVFSSAVDKQFKKLVKVMLHPEDLPDADLSKVADESFSAGRLIPGDEQLEELFRDDIHRVHRWQGEPSDGASDGASERPASGPEGLRSAVARVLSRFDGAGAIQVKFKVFRVIPDNNEITTKQYVELAGKVDEGTLEYSATWRARWRADEPTSPKLLSLDLLRFEQVLTTVPSGKLLADCTGSAIGHNSAYREQILRGYNEWLGLSQHTRYTATSLMGHPGLAIGDVNNDGLEDVFLCQEEGLPNRLFVQRADGTADEVSAAWEVDWLQDCRSALLLDLDNDGDQDLVVAFLGGVVFASNESGKKFAVRAVVRTSDDLMTLSAADFDDDGDVDVYAPAYYSDQAPMASAQRTGQDFDRGFVYHDAETGAPNSLWRNDIAAGSTDSWRFTDVTSEVGLDQNNTRFSLASSWDDFDNDGDQDLYVANDFGRDNLYRNDGGRFVDIGGEAGAEDAASGMAVAWGDYNRDGWMDVHVSNMWSGAGNRITFQPQFAASASQVEKRRLQRMARGNTLLRNTGELAFESVSREAGVEMGRWAWGCQFADLNNDGWEDLLVANGFITGEQPDDL
ncbi:MAG: VCBS repeat-containing protein [Planctomycetota bacterium]|nr:MAG: VCBS repeat-containing protein [Planctomycetota bacterium]